MPYSTEYTAIIVLVVTVSANIFGYEVVSGDLQTTIEGVASILATSWLFYKRYQRGGINALGIRKRD